jgi:hypothetical protein
MQSDTPPSGPWTGYYLYGHAGLKHRMSLSLTFTADGEIEGEGVDDVAPFVISGGFDFGMSVATWTKAYVGMHTVEYAGVYCQRAICGDWTLFPFTGGFWIWPGSLPEYALGEVQSEIELPLRVGVSTGRRGQNFTGSGDAFGEIASPTYRWLSLAHFRSPQVNGSVGRAVGWSDG